MYEARGATRRDDIKCNIIHPPITEVFYGELDAVAVRKVHQGFDSESSRTDPQHTYWPWLTICKTSRIPIGENHYLHNNQ